MHQEILDELTPNYRPKRNKANRYLQDRESLKSWSISGMQRIFNVQNSAIVEGCGEIVDRSREFLGSSDPAIIAARRQMLNAIREIQSGKETPNTVRKDAETRFPHLAVISEVITDGSDWQSCSRRKLELALH